MSAFDVIALPGAQLVLESASVESTLAVNVTEIRLAIEVSPAAAPLVLVHEPAPVDVIEVQIPGSGGGAPAPVVYDHRADVSAEDMAYRGEAAPGALETAPAWRIRRITLDASGGPVIAWAAGSQLFTARWSDRTTYTYE